MKRGRLWTALIEREGNMYVALCPELDVASQGASIEEARANLQVAIGLYLKTASSRGLGRGVRSEVYVTRVEA
jgi:predicted RNase H-like HicB family nuclease